MDLFNESFSLYQEVVPPISNVKQISSLAFNQADKSLYFVTNEQHHESQILVHDSETTRNLYHGMGIKHIAFDWVTGNIYYAANGKIYVLSFYILRRRNWCLF